MKKSVSEATEERNRTHLQVGAITRPHGVRGELKVHLHCEDSTSLKDVEHVVVERPNGEASLMEVESVRGSAKSTILRLAGVEGREGAEALRSAKLWVRRNQVTPLAEGEYFLVDLIGCSLQFEGTQVGRVTAVRADPSVDTLVLAMEDGSAAELALVPPWVGKVDIEASRIELLSRDGLIS